MREWDVMCVCVCGVGGFSRFYKFVRAHMKHLFMKKNMWKLLLLDSMSWISNMDLKTIMSN
jgi:hypothetical protein